MLDTDLIDIDVSCSSHKLFSDLLETFRHLLVFVCDMHFHFR